MKHLPKHSRSRGSLSTLAPATASLLILGALALIGAEHTYNTISDGELHSLAQSEADWIRLTNVDTPVILSPQIPCAQHTHLQGWTLYNPDLLPDQAGQCRSLTDAGLLQVRNTKRDNTGTLVLADKTGRTLWLAVKKDANTPQQIQAIIFRQTTGRTPEQSLRIILSGHSGPSDYADLSPYFKTEKSQATLLDTNTLPSENMPTGQKPHNGIFGIKQLDTQTLSAGNSLASVYGNNSEQTSTEAMRGQTANDANMGFPTILSNTNFNVTEGYRLSVADGLHITASSATITKDTNTSNDGVLDHQSSPYNTGWGLPGLTWDNGPNPWNGTSHIGMMTYLSQDPTNGDTQNTYGVDISPIQTVIATYNKNTDAHYPVGFESDGGIRAPVYYDSRSISYLVDPSGTSHMGDISLAGNGRYNPYRKNVTSGSVFTSGLGKVPWPQGWAQSGIITRNIAIRATVAAGHVVYNNVNHRYQATTNAYINSSGQGYAANYAQASFFNTLSTAQPSTHCLGDIMPRPTSIDQLPNKPQDTIGVGTLAKNVTTGEPLYCSSETGNWEPVVTNQFTNVVYMYAADIASGTWHWNNQRTTMFVSTDCAVSPYANGYKENVSATIRSSNGHNYGFVTSQTQEGGTDAQKANAPNISFMVPPGYSFSLYEIQGNSEQTFCGAMVIY